MSEKISEKLMQDIWKSETKLHEWVFRKENNELFYVPKKYRTSITDSSKYSNGVVCKTAIETINIDEVIELIGYVYPDNAHDIIILVNNIALNLDQRDLCYKG